MISFSWLELVNVFFVAAANAAAIFFSAEGAVFLQQAFILLHRNEKQLTTRNQIKLFDFNLFNSVLFIDQRNMVHAWAFNRWVVTVLRYNNKWVYGMNSIDTRYVLLRKNMWHYFCFRLFQLNFCSDALTSHCHFIKTFDRTSKIRIQATFTNSIELSANSNYAFNLFNDFYLFLRGDIIVYWNIKWHSELLFTLPRSTYI